MTLYQYIAKGVTYRTFESSRRYDEIISYNKNSAPLSLVRYGKNNTNQYTVIDALSYRYNGNQLVNVSDTCTHSLLYSNSFEFVNDNEGLSETEYTYDGNGNMKSDLNKGISSITYDKLNNPSRINYSDGKMIDYDYSADGRKLSTTYVSALSPLNPPIFPIFNSSENIFEQPSLPSAHGSQDSLESTAFVVSRLSPLASTIMSHNAHNIRNISTTKYFGNYIFENGRLDKVLFDGGYIKISPTGAWTYHYYFTDHLGSVRVVGDGGGDVEQVNHYYPYGGLIGNLSTNPDKQKYKYNGKEYDTMHGLNTYDYGARQYDGAKIVWDRMDQHCEKYYNINPYLYCAGNPVRYVDGRWYWENNGNLHAEVNDNIQTMAEFLGATHKDVMQILERNKISVGNNGIINVKNLGNLSLNKSSLYVMTADKNGTVLEGKPIETNPYVDCLNSPQSSSQTELAVAHYFLGNGEAADVGDMVTSMLMNTKIFKDNLEATTTKVRKSHEFSVDMTGLVFHIGRTPVNYTVHHGTKSSHVDFRLFQYASGRMDSFRDPLDVGIELPGGTPYNYKLRTVTYYFKPVK